MSYPSHQTVQGRLTQAVLNSPGKWAGSPFYWCEFFLHGPPAILTHWGRVTHISVRNLTIIGSDNGLLPGQRQAIIWTNVVNWTLRNKLQRTVNRNSNIFIQENAFEKIFCKMAAILSLPQCVNSSEARDGIFQLIWWIPCLLMPWPLKSPEHQQTWYWLCGTDKSTLVQLMAWCSQAMSHYLNQCWPWSLRSYGITRPKWV